MQNSTNPVCVSLKLIPVDMQESCRLFPFSSQASASHQKHTKSLSCTRDSLCRVAALFRSTRQGLCSSAGTLQSPATLSKSTVTEGHTLRVSRSRPRPEENMRKIFFFPSSSHFIWLLDIGGNDCRIMGYKEMFSSNTTSPAYIHTFMPALVFLAAPAHCLAHRKNRETWCDNEPLFVLIRRRTWPPDPSPAFSPNPLFSSPFSSPFSSSLQLSLQLSLSLLSFVLPAIKFPCLGFGQ